METYSPQSCQALAAELATKDFVENIEACGCRLSTGFIGIKDLMLALAKIGRNDVACRLIQNDTFPIMGYSLKHCLGRRLAKIPGVKSLQMEDDRAVLEMEKGNCRSGTRAK
ncbi:MAG: hypothetical protein WA117_03305 [Verrucomicrobiia bacterium]